MKSSKPCNYALVHWRDADFEGHRNRGIDNSGYKNAVRRVDKYLGEVFKLINSSSKLRGNTAIVLTSDHGFGGENHSEKGKRGNYQIPFYVWGPGVKAGADLYGLNKKTRKNPSKNRLGNSGTQPIRNQDSATVSADWLGLSKGNNDLHVN